MRPEERDVVDAALDYCDREHETVDVHNALVEAVERLRHYRAAVTSEALHHELDLTYGEVIEGDELLSIKLQKWFPVAATVLLDGGQVRVTLPGTGRPAANGRPQRNAWHLFRADKPCKVRRGQTGLAADLINRVLYSGASGRREEPDLEPGLALEMDATQDPEASLPEAVDDDESEGE